MGLIIDPMAKLQWMWQARKIKVFWFFGPVEIGWTGGHGGKERAT